MEEIEVKDVGIHIRMPAEMNRQVQVFADRMGRKRSEAIRELLRRALKQARVAPPE